MDEEMVKFWLPLWRTAVWAFVALIVSGIASCNTSKFVLLSAVKAGADPLVARCTFEGNTDGSGNACLLLYQRK